MTLSRTLFAGCLAALAAAHAGSASAQSIGAYTGTQANGSSITITVTTDSNTSKPEITAVGLGVVGSCTSNTTISVGVGVGASQDVVDKKAKVIFNGDQYYFTLSVVFDTANNTASGTITTYAVIFFPPVSGHPTKAAFCHTGTQTFTATLGAAAGLSLPAGSTLH